ncbi:efflux transporter outer membrane subunit [Undibacterium sp.]|jgi:NodT family efflux transporter outer membrane factor (OMF) lipoprotein|uniref:efflux transporter outer membrane subunit n=1 Tax=Undibacterium sp. TaxID=1914977 RepID=UPI002C10A7E0|nr:efflux transporter outer membrane subunit [Undibacterium sp.]HTD03195.1 efflux transporter outer membrane subunit [Undibacterium sp.]
MAGKHNSRLLRSAGLLAASSAAALLSACVSFSGIESNAQLKSAVASSANALPNQTGAWPDASWAQTIGGKPLQELIDAAIADNPSLQVAAARVAAAKAYVEATGADKLPTVGAGFDSTYQRFTEHGLIPPPLAGNYFSDNQLALSASYEVDFWGKHSAEMRSALSQQKTALAEQQSARLVLSSAIAHAWVQLARQYAQLDLSSQQLAIREQLDKLTQQRVKAGLDTRTDTEQSLVQVSSLKAEITNWQEAIALSRNQLAALLGQGPERGQSIPRPLLAQIGDAALPAQLSSDLLGRRPDIVAARWHVEAMQGDIDTAKTQFYPSINLSGFVGLSSLGFADFFKSGSAILGAGPSIRLPIFEGGRLRAQLKGKVAAYDGAVATYNQSLTDALHEVADQVQSMKAAQGQNKNQRIAEQASERTFQLAQQRQRVGTANMLPVLAAEGALIMQQKILLDNQMRRADLQINLIKALGGGFEATPELRLPASPAASSIHSTQSTDQQKTHPEAA